MRGEVCELNGEREGWSGGTGGMGGRGIGMPYCTLYHLHKVHYS